VVKKRKKRLTLVGWKILKIKYNPGAVGDENGVEIQKTKKIANI